MRAQALTKADRATLLHAVALERREDAGIFPRGSSQHRHFTKLEKAGLLVFESMGVSIDRESIEDREVAIYRLTDAGRKAIAPALDAAYRAMEGEP